MGSLRRGWKPAISDDQIGGMGFTLRGIDRRTNKPVAVKFFSGSLWRGSTDSFLPEFYRTSRILANLSHSTLPKVFGMVGIPVENDYGAKTLLPGLVMDWITLPPISQFQGSLRKFLEVLFLVAEGLDYLRANRVLHGDIKPKHILTDGSIVKLIDFGISVGSYREEPYYRASGSYTPEYAAPELIDVADEPGIRKDLASHLKAVWQSDQYALARTVAKLLGIPSSSNTLYTSSLPVIEKATSDDPSNRFPGSLEFVLALGEALAGQS